MWYNIATMKKTIFWGVAFYIFCEFIIGTPISSAVTTPPPAYIQTHQTQIPVSTTTVPVPPTIVPQDLPADQGEVTKDFVVSSVVVTETKTDNQTNIPTAKVIEFQGHAKPNTYITLYIYSTPIVVTVKTDSQGNWQYSLNQELEDGVHRVYVAQIDNTGSVVAKSDPIFFTKVAASVQIVSSDAVPVTPQKVNFFQQYFIVIALIILVIAIIVSLTVIGLVKRKVTDLPLESSDTMGPSDNIQ